MRIPTDWKHDPDGLNKLAQCQRELVEAVLTELREAGDDVLPTSEVLNRLVHALAWNPEARRYFNRAVRVARMQVRIYSPPEPAEEAR